jgi:uncharacterized membrane protein
VVDEASSSIVISAPSSEVMNVIADLDAYPEWSTAIKSVSVDETASDGRPATATFVLDAGVLKDTYTLAYTWDGDTSVSWTMLKGSALKSQQGSYQLREVDGGTEVTYRLTVDLKVPMLGMFKRKAEKVIIDTALKGLKKRVEGA